MPGNTVSKIAGLLFAGALAMHAPAFGAARAAIPEGAAVQAGSSKATGNPAANANAKKVTPKPRVIRRRKPRQRAQMAPTPQRISEIQSALASQGAYKAQPNGKWD